MIRIRLFCCHHLDNNALHTVRYGTYRTGNQLHDGQSILPGAPVPPMRYCTVRHCWIRVGVTWNNYCDSHLIRDSRWTTNSSRNKFCNYKFFYRAGAVSVHHMVKDWGNLITTCTNPCSSTIYPVQYHGQSLVSTVLKTEHLPKTLTRITSYWSRWSVGSCFRLTYSTILLRRHSVQTFVLAELLLLIHSHYVPFLFLPKVEKNDLKSI